MNTNEECNKQAKSIADDIEKIVSRNYYYDESGSLVELSENDDEHEPATLWDFFNDALDIKWEVSRSSGKLEVCGGRVMVGFGGPNIWVTNNSVEVYWWSERGTCELSLEAGDAVLEYLRDTFAE